MYISSFIFKDLSVHPPDLISRCFATLINVLSLITIALQILSDKLLLFARTQSTRLQFEYARWKSGLDTLKHTLYVQINFDKLF